MIHSRRAFCRQSLTVAASAALCGLVRNPVALAQTTFSPEGALQQLIDGNRRFAEGRMTSFAEDLDILRAKTVEKQEPFAAVGCDQLDPDR